MEHKLSAVQVLLHTCSIEIIALKKKGFPIFKAFRKGPLIRHTCQGGIAHRAESTDCQPCWFRPWRHEVARSGGQVPQGEGTKAGGPSQEPRAMALGPGFPKWWGGVEFWNQYLYYIIYLNITLSTWNHISAIKPSLQDGIVYCDPIQHFITF